MKAQMSPAAGPSSFKIKNLRWYICGLVFLATVINYIDRQVFSILAPDLQQEIGWSEIDYGRMVIAFQVSYAVMMLFAGRIIDRIGTKLGFALAFLWWSLAEIGHAFARSAFGFGVARFFLGLGEAANFPAAVKTTAEWFPKSERGLATGIWNSATTIGAIAAPIAIPLMAADWGWQGAFIGTGAIGLIWLAGWWALYRLPESHPHLSDRERAWIQQDSQESSHATITWRKLLGYRQTWAYAVGKIMADPVWWFYLFWLPKFLAQEHGIRGHAVIPFLSTVYVICGCGSVLGGWLSSTLIRRGWTVNRARKTALGAAAILMPIVMAVGRIQNPWIAVILIGAATALHQAWSTNIFTLASDMFPSRAVGSVIGLGGLLGGIGSVLAAEYTGRLLQSDPGAYASIFFVAGSIYLAALAIIHLLVPRLDPADIR
jgi:ACS family hexuronate transporter-like MFS transporter